MVRAEQKLHRHPLSEQPGGDVGGDDASADMLVFIGAVKTCQGDRVGDFLRVIVHVSLHKVSNIVAGAYKGGGPVGQGVQKPVDILRVGENVYAFRQTVSQHLFFNSH